MNNKFTLTISILLLCLILIACNFTNDETRNDRQKPVVKTENGIDETKSKNKKKTVQSDENEETENSENTTVLGNNEYQKIETFPCNINPMGHALIASELSREELIELAQEIHIAEPETVVFLIDDKSEANDHINFMKQWCKGEFDKSTFPEDWADRHVIAVIARGKDATWDLYEGAQKKVYLDYDFDDKEKTKITDLRSYSKN